LQRVQRFSFMSVQKVYQFSGGNVNSDPRG
jgi:hypothetical protein